MVFRLAKILRPKQFLGADNLRALLRGAFRESERLLQVRGGISRARSLEQAKIYSRGGRTFHSASF
jgi:hypothetical protein